MHLLTTTFLSTTVYMINRILYAKIHITWHIDPWTDMRPLWQICHVIWILACNILYHISPIVQINWVECCLMCFIAIVKPFFKHWFDYGLFRLPDQDYGLTADVTGQQGMLTPPRHLIPTLVCPGVRDCPTLVFVFYFGLARLITVRYLYIIFAYKC